MHDKWMEYATYMYVGLLFDSHSLSVLNVLKIGGVQLYFGGDRVLKKVQSRFSL